MATKRVAVDRRVAMCATCASAQPMTRYASVAWRRRFGVVPRRVVERVREVCDRCGWSTSHSPRDLVA